MASTSEELSGQAEILQSTIAFFKTGEEQQVRPSKGARRAGSPGATTATLKNMQQVFKRGGASIQLGSNHGNADARDRDFAPYQA